MKVFSIALSSRSMESLIAALFASFFTAGGLFCVHWGILFGESEGVLIGIGLVVFGLGVSGYALFGIIFERKSTLYVTEETIGWTTPKEVVEISLREVKRVVLKTISDIPSITLYMSNGDKIEVAHDCTYKLYRFQDDLTTSIKASNPTILVDYC